MDIIEYIVKEFHVISEAPVLVLLIIVITSMAAYWLVKLRYGAVGDRLALAQDQIADRNKRIQELKDRNLSKQTNDSDSLAIKDLHKSLIRFSSHPDLFQIHIPGKTSIHVGPLPSFATANLRAEWKETIEGLCKQLGENILYYRFGEKYHFLDLSNGEHINIPTNIPKGLTLADTGIRSGLLLELRAKTTSQQKGQPDW